MDTLPLIDFSQFAKGTAAARRSIADDIAAACRDSGFFLLTHHGLDRQISDAAFDAAAAFFDRPLTDKQKIAIENSACHRGWFGLGGEVLDGVRQPQGDQKEGLKIGRDLAAHHPRVKASVDFHGPNQWPHQDGFQTAMQACYAACEDLSHQLMQGFALSLGLADDYFERWLSLPMATLAPLRYPPMHKAQGGAQGEAQGAPLGAAAHTDFGCLTLLMQRDIPGLEVQLKTGDWLRIPAEPDVLVVNIGDMMARWTNGRYASTRHRVINRTAQPRPSMAFFFDPDPNANLAPLPGCGTTQHAELTALEHLQQKIKDSFAYMSNPS